MLNTIFGTKFHLTQAWDQVGVRLPITIIKTNPMTVTQIKTESTDGYQAIQVGFGASKWSKITRPLQGHIKKSLQDQTGASQDKKLAPRFLREVKVEKTDEFKPGDMITLSQVLETGDVVNVTGVSKGKGFTGVMKRWGFKGGSRTHGQSDRLRAPGSIGQGTDPGRVHKGKKMPGHAGAEQVTVRNLTVVKVDPEKDELWLKGQVPGSSSSVVAIKRVGKNSKFPGLFEAKELKKKAKKAEEEIIPKQEVETKIESVEKVKTEEVAQTQNEDVTKVSTAEQNIEAVGIKVNKD